MNSKSFSQAIESPAQKQLFHPVHQGPLTKTDTTRIMKVVSAGDDEESELKEKKTGLYMLRFPLGQEKQTLNKA